MLFDIEDRCTALEHDVLESLSWERRVREDLKPRVNKLALVLLTERSVSLKCRNVFDMERGNKVNMSGDSIFEDYCQLSIKALQPVFPVGGGWSYVINMPDSFLILSSNRKDSIELVDLPKSFFFLLEPYGRPLISMISTNSSST